MLQQIEFFSFFLLEQLKIVHFCTHTSFQSGTKRKHTQTKITHFFLLEQLKIVYLHKHCLNLEPSKSTPRLKLRIHYDRSANFKDFNNQHLLRD